MSKKSILRGRGVRGTRARKLADYFSYPQEYFKVRLMLGVSFLRLADGTYTKNDLDAIAQLKNEIINEARAIEEKFSSINKYLDKSEALLGDGK